MDKTMYTFKVSINEGAPLHKTVVVYADSDKEAEFKATQKIIREFAAVYSPGKDTLKLEIVSKV